ncbi:D-alanyl-D-alanine carboxypeptidase family protein [Clostridium kluyveri]|uniref:serine-type D-Ala-D-Ala carboxypeptidase n=1 Tax=Clostridium kluyveri TaxID=1534 RepID=A0A1L5F5H6_CLOKL|nr:D-alanyl-D-alanine carboxypeptidase family protein [Clostridium kluyveri]APM38268.1 D-alanyl-D-alanine carboxypeptidase [Clostridium kluyveri]UZQ51721.1 D-alanyl-D-alanine carboxypeptidase [Clostridium kluyveri]
MKKIVTFILFFLIICYINPYNVYATQTLPSVSADSAVLLDAATGEVLYAKNPDSAYPPASTTKIMTALLTLENANLNDKVTVGKNPPLVDGTRIGLYEGEELTVKDLLYGLLLASANDCAEALAEYIGNGSSEKFAIEMNKKAHELGAYNTNFVNPSGLFDEKHKTSAKDLALIMRELCKNPEYSKIATTLYYTIPPTNKSPQERGVWNENKLIQSNSTYYYSGCEGGKTGYTTQSLHSYVSAATRNGQRLIVALVHDKNKTFFPDSISLFNFGFDNFSLVKLYSKGDLVTTYNKNNISVPLTAASDFYYVKNKNDTAVPSFTLKNSNLSVKFFNTGEVVEEATISFKGKNIGKLPLLSSSSHYEKQTMASAHIENIIKNKYIIFISIMFILTLIVSFTIRRFVISK